MLIRLAVRLALPAAVVSAAVALAAVCWIAEAHRTTQAAFPGTNGRVVFVAGSNNVMTMDPDGGHVTVVPSALDAELEPAFGPDGRTIVFRGLGSGGSANALYLTTGGGPTKIPNTEGNFYDPSFAPSGDAVSFDSTGAGGAADIWAINTNGTGLRNITQSMDGNEFSSAWSPGGTRIAYVRQEQGTCCATDIWVMDANGHNQTDITNTPGVSESSPDWSPGGARIIFSRTKDITVAGTPQTPGNIAVMNADGSDYHLITTDDSFGEYDPAFSPDGQQIVYQATPTSVSVAGFEAAIVVSNADGSHPVTISPPGVYYEKPDWGLAEPASTFAWGDNDCSDEINALDALPTLLHEAEVAPAGAAGVADPVTGCPAMSQTLHTASFGDRIWGDLDCSGRFDAPDVLLILRQVAELPPATLQDCPALGIEIALQPG